jgi:ABC-2 type transport system permease protein
MSENRRAETDRGAYRIVARREFRERFKDRGFRISTGITLTIMVGFLVITSLAGGRARYDLAVVGRDASEVGNQIESASAALAFDVTVHELDDEAAAGAAVRAGRADAALIGVDRIIVKSDGPSDLVGTVQAVSERLRSRQVLEDAGLSPDQADEALDVRPLPIRALEPIDERRRQLAAVAFVGVLMLYGQLFAYGYWVAAGVVEEKVSRVVEVLLSAIRPSQLLRGKILGIGLLGLCQLSLIGLIGFATALGVGRLDFPGGALGAIGIVLLWFLFGYAFYASLFAVAGSIVSRQEDLQATMTPVSLIIIASFFLGIQAVGNPDSTLATVSSLMPWSAPLSMPSRIMLGQASISFALLSAAISVAATAALIPVATRVYANAVLRPGRVRLRDALVRRPAG